MLMHAKTEQDLYRAIVNSPFKAKSKGLPLGLGLVVMVLVNKKANRVDRIALSDTEPAKGAVDYSVKAFDQINIPLDQTQNFLVKSIVSQQIHETEDWNDTFTPVLTAEEARFNQAGAGAGCTVIYPFKARDGGAMSFSYVIPLKDINEAHHKFMSHYTELVEHFLNKNLASK